MFLPSFPVENTLSADGNTLLAKILQNTAVIGQVLFSQHSGVGYRQGCRILRPLKFCKGHGLHLMSPPLEMFADTALLPAPTALTIPLTPHRSSSDLPCYILLCRFLQHRPNINGRACHRNASGTYHPIHSAIFCCYGSSSGKLIQSASYRSEIQHPRLLSVSAHNAHSFRVHRLFQSQRLNYGIHLYRCPVLWRDRHSGTIAFQLSCDIFTALHAVSLQSFQNKILHPAARG